ncbi:30S ribosomal protein S4e [Candidatus Mancarchaeum acidiphilum]|uniref:30S ribosomal protein S4e n=1 Tax=Candidatus Mancarchaeum acidiphilum TaxID=1920749 RepID=A0A218NLU0_9ARCH|nr:S4 domain-containing protein [Candidatus Mancarchaeum acidiphilum]ASI13412.1 30S ribosomal protein S4e [Candidatus Mancarchaeum acidiphilum]
MAKKGGTNHIKSLAAPEFFNISRKEETYVARPLPGRHNLYSVAPLEDSIKKLGYSDNYSDAAKVIKSGKIKVNGKTIKEKKFPIGLNDVISIGKANYLVSIDKFGHISFNETKAPEHFIYKVVGKDKFKGNKIRVRLNSGTVIDAGENAGKINPGDSVKIDSNNKIIEVIKMKKGAKCTVVSGVHVATSGSIEDIKPGNIHTGKVVIIKDDKGEIFETLEKNIITMS